mmetsp:Transcript_68704/g.161532  ORF Transcript_68704/g.161532 Transcript_68704/m.161532 type:complete len:202 (+) Transcript_68704:1587-2192(+)
MVRQMPWSGTPSSQSSSGDRCPVACSKKPGRGKGEAVAIRGDARPLFGVSVAASSDTMGRRVSTAAGGLLSLVMSRVCSSRGARTRSEDSGNSLAPFTARFRRNFGQPHSKQGKDDTEGNSKNLCSRTDALGGQDHGRANPSARSKHCRAQVVWHHGVKRLLVEVVPESQIAHGCQQESKRSSGPTMISDLRITYNASVRP